MNKYYLLKYYDNYIDEFDVNAIQILTEEEKKKYYDKAKNNINKLNKKRFVSLGTNEDIEYEKGSDFIKMLVIEELPETKAKTIIKYIGKRYGMINILWNIQEILRDADLLKDKWYPFR